MPKRDRMVLIVIGVAALLAGYWMLALSPKREEAAGLKKQTSEQAKRRDAALAQVRTGEDARRTFGEDYAAVVRLGKAVPVNDETPSLLYQLQSAARGENVDLRVMKVRAAGGSAPATAVADATQAAAAVAPPGSAVGPAGFPTMPFTFKFEGDFFRMERMFAEIERFTSTVPSGEDVEVLGRLITVDGFSLSQSKIFGFPRVHASVAATAYVLPPGEGAVDGATPEGPAGAAGNGQTAGSPGAKPVTAAAGGMTP